MGMNFAHLEAKFVEKFELSQAAYLVAKRFGIAVDASNRAIYYSWKISTLIDFIFVWFLN